MEEKKTILDLLRLRMAAIQGYSCTSASSPPTILSAPFTPHSGGEGGRGVDGGGLEEEENGKSGAV